MLIKKFSALGIFYVAIVLFSLFVIAVSESSSSCYASRMKILLDSASDFIKDAWDLTKDIKKYEKDDLPECLTKPKDCYDVLKAGHNKSGVYSVWPQNRIAKDEDIKVFCDMETVGGGWTVIQRRGDFGRAKDYFFKEWNYYKAGFGKITEDFWLGNDNIFSLTNQRLYTLRIDMQDLLREKRYAAYDNFWIDGEEYDYTLHVTGFTGNAGDSFGNHNGMKFSTKDKDNDINPDGNCAAQFKGAWWYLKCHTSNLNGLYLNGTHTTFADGIEWHSWKGYNYSLPFVEMKIRSFAFESNTMHELNPRK